MKYFWLRFSVYFALWIYSIVQYSHHTGLSIFLFAVAIGIFFFLSLEKVSIFLYLLLSIIIVLHHQLLMEDNLFTLNLLLYVSIIATFKLRESNLKLYLLFNAGLIVTISFLYESNIMTITVITALFYFLIIALNHYQQTLKEQRRLYDELLGEYRKQKRVILIAEQDAKAEERNRIARDIHDSVGHRLTALILKLEMLAIQRKNNDYRELKKMAEESLEETRHAVRALQSEDSEGIATVVNLIRKLEAESQIVVQFTMKQGVLTVPLSNQNNVVLYRVIQEALTNAMRHGHSREVHVILGKSAVGDVTFEVSNTIYEKKPIQFGFGLTNMRKRVEEVDGRLDVYQQENQFTVSGIIPA